MLFAGSAAVWMSMASCSYKVACGVECGGGLGPETVRSTRVGNIDLSSCTSSVESCCRDGVCVGDSAASISIRHLQVVAWVADSRPGELLSRCRSTVFTAS
jgi:hypothetical protein